MNDRTDKGLKLLVLIVLVAAVWTAVSLRQASELAEQWERARAGSPVADDAVPGLRVARALHLSESGQRDDALEIYRRIEAEHPDDPVVRIARFNSANIYLRDAMEMLDAGERGRALPLIEIAKQLFRQLLLEDPGDWDVRYNLSRAVLMIPDILDSGEVTSTPESAERAASTMRGFAPGLP